VQRSGEHHKKCSVDNLQPGNYRICGESPIDGSAKIDPQEGDAVAGANSSVLNRSVLVLNRNYMALRVVTVQRAFCLLFRQLAQVISTEDGKYNTYDFESWTELSQLKREYEPDAHEWLRTVRYDIAVPRIIRLIFYDKLPRQEVKFNRRNIFARDRSSCQYCGKHFMTSELSIDHIVPRSQGGKETWDNVVCCCLKCNVRKGGRTPDQASMKLITKPVRPKRSPIISLKVTTERYASWKEFIDQAYWSVELKE
jgi:5-methylcytosine-specific restriction endonuclease McrA